MKTSFVKIYILATIYGKFASSVSLSMSFLLSVNEVAPNSVNLQKKIAIWYMHNRYTVEVMYHVKKIKIYKT
jgi:hypothetical protein